MRYKANGRKEALDSKEAHVNCTEERVKLVRSVRQQAAVCKSYREDSTDVVASTVPNELGILRYTKLKTANPR